MGVSVYVTNDFKDNVTVISTQTNTVVGNPIPVGLGPIGVATDSTGNGSSSVTPATGPCQWST